MTAETTINQVFENRVARYGERLAVEKKRNGQWEQASWTEYYDRSRSVGLGLHALGVVRGDRVALLSENRLEWLYTDMGALGIGACLVPLYPTLSVDEVGHIVRDSGAKVFIVENRIQFDKALAVREMCPDLEKIILIQDDIARFEDAGIFSFEDLMMLGRAQGWQGEALFKTLSAAVGQEDLATIVYTSGTTGVPKGAMITHGNIISVLQSLDSIEPRYAFDTDQTVPFLPLSHVFERVAGHFYGMYVGITASYAESVETVLHDIQGKRPTLILAVPRVCEKVYQRIMMQVKEQPAWRQKVFYWGHDIGARISRLKETQQSIPLFLGLRYRIAYALIFKKLKEALGGRVRWMTASGAPTAPEIIRFFNAAGIVVVEGYGMTECTAPATMSNLAHYRIGTVGKALPGVDIRLDDDGEILVRGNNVFKGYWNMEAETRNAFTEDGFLRTGDIGVLSEEGFLRIVDRKKDLIITSGGKNISPQKIENLFMSDALFAFIVVIGDDRKYLTALVNINLEEAADLAAKQGLTFENPEDLLQHPGFITLLNQHVETVNSRLARYETIKRYAIVKHAFSKETGELTDTLKIKRPIIRKKYQDVIDAMYLDDAPFATVVS
jgi:long-chain acyl-CoA synthetase